MIECPEALYGAHGVPNTQGKCPYCGTKIASRNWNQAHPDALRRSPRSSITHEVERMIDERWFETDDWGRRVIPPWQNPEVDPDLDDYIYD